MLLLCSGRPRPVLQESDLCQFSVMASWYSKSAEKWCDSASLPIRLHRTTCTLVCVSRPESRVHRSVRMSTMLATDYLLFG